MRTFNCLGPRVFIMSSHVMG